MEQPYIDAAIKAEIKRAILAGYAPNRRYLMRETGLRSMNLERAISRVVRQMKLEGAFG